MWARERLARERAEMVTAHRKWGPGKKWWREEEEKPEEQHSFQMLG